MTTRSIAMGTLILLAGVGTGCGKSKRVEELQAAFATSKISLVEAIDLSKGELAAADVGKAQLNTRLAQAAFQVRGSRGSGNAQVTVDPQVARMRSVEAYDRGVVLPCEGSITTAEAVAIAEQQVKGRGAAVEIEDCVFEVQVLAGDTLWEVEIGPDGRYLEKEEWDEEDESEDDD